MQAAEGWYALGTAGLKDYDPRFASEFNVAVARLEDRFLNLTLRGNTENTGWYRLQVLLDGEEREERELARRCPRSCMVVLLYAGRFVSM